MSFTFLAILDFEATCEDRKAQSSWDVAKQEIIELPVALVSVHEQCVVDSYGTFVRPILQPTLTSFCTELTTIRQEDLVGQPTIALAMAGLIAWFDGHGVTAENTCVVTCGDWDLFRMWPKQVSHVPELETPDVFRRWCNLKHPAKRHIGRRAQGMMSMLRGLNLPHQGVHHRGADDVANIARIVIRLLEMGATIEPTWGETERIREHARYLRVLDETRRTLSERRLALEGLPGGELSVGAEGDERSRLQDAIDALSAEYRSLSIRASVFARSLPA